MRVTVTAGPGGKTFAQEKTQTGRKTDEKPKNSVNFQVPGIFYNQHGAGI